MWQGCESPSTVGAEEDAEDSVPELNEDVVDDSPPAVGAEEDVLVGLVVLDADPLFWLEPPSTVDAEEELEDSVPELNEDVVDIGVVVLDEPPIFWLSANFLGADDYRL